MSNNVLPNGYVTFGGDANCTLSIPGCDPKFSVYGGRPNHGANIFFTAAYALLMFGHIYLGYRWRSWGFMTGMILGCISEIIGYAGRLLLWKNPFDFTAFLIQIICLTIAPVFFTASIYVTLSKTIVHFAPELSRFRPQLFYWIFIPADVVCLVLQSAGGALSTGDSGQVGVDVSLAGLILQVIVLVLFIITFGDYMFRYWRSGRMESFTWRTSAFFTGLSVSITLILARCCYRVAELQDGYDGKLIREEVPFIILEGVFILIAGIALCFGHPGLVFGKETPAKKHVSDDNLPVSERV